MSEDMTTLQFYLDHEEETRSERENFLKGEDVDPGVIPKHIHDSWLRSKALGVNPYTMNIPLRKKIVSVKNAEQFLRINPVASYYGDVEKIIRNFGCEINFAGHNGLTLGGTPDDAKHYYSNREKFLGTCASAIAFETKQPARCFGHQNYKTPFSQQFGLSNPVFDTEQNFIGVVTILLPRPRPTREQCDMAEALLELMRLSFYQQNTNETNTKEQYDLLSRALPFLSDGVILFDRHGNIARHNESALRILGAKKSESSDKIIDKLEQYRSRHTRHRDGSNGNGRDAQIEHRINAISGDDKSASLIILKEPRSSYRHPASGTGAAPYTFKDLLGEDRDFLRAKHEAFIVAPTNASVLLCGETGSGKEVFAQSIHNDSLRREAPFFAVNCGAVPDNLIESELFGYEAGSFTGASPKGKIGILEAASGGTLFLDEVESMPPHVQVRLLRALSIGIINRVGGIMEIPLNIRVVSATKCDLLQMGTEGRFREDLYYRLSTCRIRIPPLRDRRSDIPILARYFVAKMEKDLGYSDISLADSFLESLYYYDWRGNVRELENTIERALIFMNPEKKILDRTLLYPELLEEADFNRSKNQNNTPALDSARLNLLKAGEAQTIEKCLVQCNYNIPATAQTLSMTRQTLYRKIRANPALRRFVEEHKQNSGGV
ncbi:MAG: sigma 54-interacting transcriptional regulator [Gracilibacteraceae bacterium]|jgi:transcriptional regulator with PAS, ATPase and Fis domain|nr:sigma 54-interacting transcriptional regulator [Gracilibacteraceae bacterium]